MQIIKNILLIFQQTFPNKIEVELISDSSITNSLLFLNILVSIVGARYIQVHIEKKAKEFEVKAHIKKIKAEKIIKFCINANTIFNDICVKNPVISPIDEIDIKKLDKLVLSEEIIFLDDNFIDSIKDFRDYIIQIMEDSKNKNIKKEKNFFLLIKKKLNSEDNDN